MVYLDRAICSQTSAELLIAPLSILPFHITAVFKPKKSVIRLMANDMHKTGLKRTTNRQRVREICLISSSLKETE